MNVGKQALLSFLLIYMLTSCSNLSFYNDSDRQILVVSPKTDNQENYIVEFESETLLWGMLPKENKLDIYENINLSAYTKVGNLSIKIYQTTLQKFFMIASLGIYIPETIQYSFWGEYKISE